MEIYEHLFKKPVEIQARTPLAENRQKTGKKLPQGGYDHGVVDLGSQDLIIEAPMAAAPRGSFLQVFYKFFTSFRPYHEILGILWNP